MENLLKGTTICAVKKDGKTVVCGDGQVTMSQSVIFKNFLYFNISNTI